MNRTTFLLLGGFLLLGWMIIRARRGVSIGDVQNSPTFKASMDSNAAELKKLLAAYPTRDDINKNLREKDWIAGHYENNGKWVDGKWVDPAAQFYFKDPEPTNSNIP